MDTGSVLPPTLVTVDLSRAVVVFKVDPSEVEKAILAKGADLETRATSCPRA